MRYPHLLVAAMTSCFFIGGSLGTLAGALAATPVHGTVAVIAWTLVGLAVAVAIAVLVDVAYTRIKKRLAARRAECTARDFRASIEGGLTESFDTFSRRLDQSGPKASGGSE
ncbi:hypothetical protein [Streptomyces roseochromogenus]|uniref:Uncharacterized protein n=1 Tax=Streptomyces roseochromogenus subsp. oscitans DS 12.976 TaxID=1352936 RepID=V6JXR8_STRRC|nr:hypothetical protein [Streptomyces roseochromogenus]EST24503.1 hypothetical protein M878_30520 [Streptomyces roseochromogenus subsp. oscitans DS 12.976]